MTDTPNKIGSLLDLLPKPNTDAWAALPEFVRLEVEQLRKGHRPMSRGAVGEAELMPRRVDLLELEYRNIGEQLADIRQAQREFADTALPILSDLRQIVKEHSTRLASHDDRHAAHDKRFEQHGTKLLAHETKHVEHEGHITGVFKRLTVLEMAVINVPKPKPKRRKTRK